MQITYTPKYELGDILYSLYTERYYLIQGFSEIGHTLMYDFLILNPTKKYNTVEVAANSVDIDPEYHKVA